MTIDNILAFELGVIIMLIILMVADKIMNKNK